MSPSVVVLRRANKTVMAKIARLQGELEEARSLAVRALQIKEAVFGAEHLGITSELIGLAYILAESDDIESRTVFPRCRCKW